MENKDVRKKFRIGGMTCISCQNRIEKRLRTTEGVKSAVVSYKEGNADITYDTSVISFGDISTIIEELDYKVLSANEKRRPEASRVIGILLIIVSLYVLLQQFGILNLLVPSQLADAKMGYGMLFVIGLITSIHCVAMCGGINLSQCIPQAGMLASKAGATGNRNHLSTFKPAFLYNLGRVISYTVLGFILGFVGLLFGGSSGSGLSVFAQGILKLIAGVFMVIMGINMLGIFPWFRKLQPQMPKFLSRKVNREKARNNSPLIVGLLNGLMPCGPLQSMQIVALASGNPFAGALSMFLFSLGTVPLMLGLGSIVSALGKKFTQKVMSIGAVLVVVLGLAMLSQGGSLSGLLPPDLLLPIILGLCVVGIVHSIPFRGLSNKSLPTIVASIIVIAVIFVSNTGIINGTASAENSANVNIVDGKQVVTSTLSSGRYPNITVQAGTPVKWIINAPKGSINGCNDKFNIQAFGISNYEFKPGDNVIEFNPTKTGRFQYSCWMGMIHGTITVADAASSNNGSSEEESTAQNDIDNGNAEATDPVPAGYKIPTDKVELAKEITYQGYPMQEITIELTDKGFSPAVIVVKSGLDVKWNIKNSSSATGSGTQLLVPNYATQLTLKEGETSVSFTPDSSFDFSTGDNKFYGYLKVVDDISKADIASIKKEAADFQTLIWPAETFQQNSGSDASAQTAKATIKDGVQYVTSTVSAGGYQPIQVQKGIPVKWTLNAPSGSLTGCNNSIEIPEYNLQIKLKTGDNLIEFTPDKSGTFVFSCWMGMVRSNITVANDDGTVDATEDDGSSDLPSCCG